MSSCRTTSDARSGSFVSAARPARPSDRLAAHVLVRVGAGDFAEHIDLGKPADGSPPDAGVRVLTGEREQRVCLFRT